MTEDRDDRIEELQDKVDELRDELADAQELDGLRRRQRSQSETKDQSANGSGDNGKRNVGRIEEIQGVVIEAVFPEKLPEINYAISVKREKVSEDEDETSGVAAGVLVCEVQQHLGDDRVRAVAMDTTDGLARGMEVRRHRRARSPSRWARRPWGESSTCWARRSTRATRWRARSAGRSTARRPTSRT